ncbi:hypothetical protein [Tardiphaga sp.]|uniref:hypothetical protein n=1 Tax=Tardiphaga sp. TaxID=1926292 RepID=UPI00261710D2|nr:hypothetical protein [Tardiphaga sp.]MDB5617314.1 hypothetical protein [Tardiphaga sp.]
MMLFMATRHHSVALLVMGLLFMMALTPTRAETPQKIYGCTATQIQSGAADACLKKTESDIIANYTNVHVIRCCEIAFRK